MPEESCIRLLVDVKPQLEADGWIVEVDPDYPMRLAVPDQDRFSLDVREPSVEEPGVDWFDLSLGVMIDGERVDLLPTFTQLLSRLPAGRELDALAELVKNAGGMQGRLLAALPGGRILPLSLDKVAPILTALLSVWGSAELAAGPKLHPAQARDLADLESSCWPRGAGRRHAPQGARRGACRIPQSPPPAELPAWFRGSLRPYQQSGVDWLQMRCARASAASSPTIWASARRFSTLLHLRDRERGASRLAMRRLWSSRRRAVVETGTAETRTIRALSRASRHPGGLARRYGAVDGAGSTSSSHPIQFACAAISSSVDLALQRASSMRPAIKNPRAGTGPRAALRASTASPHRDTPVENHLRRAVWILDALPDCSAAWGRIFATLFRTPIEKGNEPARWTALRARCARSSCAARRSRWPRTCRAKTEIVAPSSSAAAQHELYEAIRMAMQRRCGSAIRQRGSALNSSHRDPRRAH